MDANLKSAISALCSALNKNGYKKEATELQAIEKAQELLQDPKPQSGGRFVEGRPPQESKEPPAPEQQPLFRGQPGSAAPVLELSRIIDHIEQNPSFRNLPEKVIQGIMKLKKMTRDAFRYASEKEAFLGFGGKKDPVKELQEYLFSFDSAISDKSKIPDDVKRALNNLNALVSQYVSRLPKEKTLLEKGRDIAEKSKGMVRNVADKGRDVARGISEKGKGMIQDVADKGRDVARGISEKGKGMVQDVAEKGRQFKQDLDEKRQINEDAKTYKTMKRFEDTQALKDREDSALSNLKKSLFDNKQYRNIFYRLPPQIIKVLDSIGLGVDDLGNMATAKVACHINNTLLNYLNYREAYSKKELNLGIKEEKEHTDVYNTFAKSFDGKKRKAPLTIREFAQQIAKAHLKEDPQYYTKLKKTFSKDAMDFSGIGNVMTPVRSLDERELARVIRLAISAELDAVHLYEVIVDSSKDEVVKNVLQDIADEEKVHAGELQELLKKFDKDDEKFLEEGRKEVKDMIG